MLKSLRFGLMATLLLLPIPSPAGTLDASLEMDTTVSLTTFKPWRIFGNNVPAWTDPVPVRDKIQAAGNYLLRIPGGSWGDVYHWNGKGTYDALGQWVPSDTEYSPSVLEKGYQSKHFATRAHDGDGKTAWMSHPETDAPEAQWIYLDLGSQREVEGVEVTWGDAAGKFPYAKKFNVQYWNPSDSRQWMVHGADKSAWMDILRDVKGTGGTQKLSFEKTKTQYVRLLLKESSQGKGGLYSVAEYKVLVDGAASPLAGWIPCVASSTNGASSGMDERKVFGFEEYMDFLGSFTPRKAEPLVIVNFGTGTPQEAAAWVHYANKVKGYGIKYWEIGNEVGGQWEAGGPVHSVDYARRYILFYEAMKKADPSIQIVAQCGIIDPSGAYDGKLALQSFTDRLARDKKEKYLDIVSVHQYPHWKKPVAELLDTPRKDMADLLESTNKQLSAYPHLAQVPVWISEFNTSDQVIPDISVHIDNGLWLAQYLGEFIRNFGPRGYASLWDVMNGGSATKDPKGSDHGYLQEEPGPYRYQERADYWAMQMMATLWATPADETYHFLMEATASEPMLAPYGVRRPDGRLALLVVNKDPQNAYKTSIKLKEFHPASVAEAWTFDSSNYKWKSDGQPPYHADPSKPPTPVKVKMGKGGCTFTFPAYSISVIRFNEVSGKD